MKLLKLLARERAVIGGVLGAVGEGVVELAKYDHLTWRLAVPVVVGVAVRFFVTPTTKAAS